MTISSQRGFSLLIVLLSLGLIALLVAGLAAAGRTDAEVAVNLRGSVLAEAAADGAIQQTNFRLHSRTWPIDGAVRRIAVGAAAVEMAIEDQRGRINPNLMSPSLMATLLRVVGVDSIRARDLARYLRLAYTDTGLDCRRTEAGSLSRGQPPLRAGGSTVCQR